MTRVPKEKTKRPTSRRSSSGRGAAAASPPAPPKPKAARRVGRITVYAEVTEEDRRDLTITAAILGVEKGQLVRALVREHTSDSPTPEQLERLRELLDKHA